MEQPFIEVVTFTLKPGTDPARFQQGVAASWRFLRGRPGFLGRHLARAEDGGMIDIVLWRDHASAQAAAGAFMAEPSLEPFGAAMTEESVVMRHYAALPPAG
ncbi:MAG: hypothetical protein O9325_02655 [Roseomonas sp.]|nr:hypothetical protein [Roseomonas sp.]